MKLLNKKIFILSLIFICTIILFLKTTVYHLPYEIINVINMETGKAVDNIDSSEIRLPAGNYAVLFGIGKESGRYIIHNIKTRWEENVPRTVSYYASDYYGKKLIKNGLNKNKGFASYIRMEISCDCPVHLTKIKISGKPSYQRYLRKEQIIMNPNDMNNPLSVYRVPITHNIELLARDLLKGNNLSPHQKIIKFMDYIQNYWIGTIYYTNYNLYLTQLAKEQIGACGDYCNMVSALAATQGIKTRIITLANYPKNSGHVVIEAYINNRWSMYDPTYDLYYTTTPDNFHDPYVLSFEELRSYNENDYKNVSRIILNESHITSDLAYKYFDPEIYKEANPAGVLSPYNKLFYPNTIYVDETIDFSKANTLAYQGATFLGVAEKANAHLWTIEGLEANKKYSFKIYGQMGGETFEDFAVYAKSSNALILYGNDYIFSNNGNKKSWEIIFESYGNTAEILLDFYEKPDLYHYIHIDKISISKYFD